ncbi:MAG: class I SAM-dependent methyltransferase [Clostridia bacterium]|jgi:ubiquinone/menaquinone biosynthesis C-methylase UbiE|nr:class I SAM-dependent methyltransferase [Clostridia bacterium]MCI2000008.1 class I SAM-dependent methyltransferase [Clostridia bacterium]MCI2014458.1 class I SAM-dependent methyltransferase [Clostridia bacterium]
MLKKLFQNTRKPIGAMGWLILKGMNKGHAKLASWGLSYLHLKPNAHVLDVGCGGGANIEKLLSACHNGFVAGIDYSADSVAFSKKKNIEAIKKSHCRILQADVGKIPFKNDTFDAVTAFETIYFWPNLIRAFSEIFRVLKTNGQFLVVCETGNPNDTKWTDMIDGMKIYTGEDLKTRLEQSGFSQVKINKNENGWICLLCIK